jgi:hypothetical protein
MAVYAGPSRRRRVTIAIAVVALVVGLIVGVIIGKASAPSIDSKIADGRTAGSDLITSLGVLPLEYSQASQGSEGTNLIGDTVKRATAGLPDALDKQPWLSSIQRQTATSAVRAIETAATAKVKPKRFEQIVKQSSATLQSVFGLPSAPAG